MTSEELIYDKNLDREIVSLIKTSEIGREFSLSPTALTFTDFLADKILMIFVIRQGVPYSLFSKIQRFTPFSENDWAELLDISAKSLHRYKQADKTFKPTQSEKIIEMAEVTKIGLDAFGDIDKFKLWLDTPNFALGRIKPLELKLFPRFRLPHLRYLHDHLGGFLHILHRYPLQLAVKGVLTRKDIRTGQSHK